MCFSFDTRIVFQIRLVTLTDETKLMPSTQNENSYGLENASGKKSFNTNVRSRKFIQKNSSLFWCFTLLYLLHMWTIFNFIHTEKEFINRATLNLSARWNRKFVHYPRAREKKGIAESFVAAAHFVVRISERNLWAWRAFCVKNYKSMKFKSMMIISLSLDARRQCIWTLSIQHYKIPTKKSGNSFVLRIRIFQSFFFPSRTNSKKILWVVEFFIYIHFATRCFNNDF